MSVTRCIGAESDALCCATVCREILPGRLEGQQVSSWPYPSEYRVTSMAPPIVTSQHARKSSTRCSCDSDRELDDEETGVHVPSEEVAQLSIDKMEMSRFQAGTTAVSKADVVANVGESNRLSCMKSHGV